MVKKQTGGKPKSRRKKRSKAEPEKIIRAVQAVAASAVVAYKMIKPHINKLRKRGRLKQ